CGGRRGACRCGAQARPPYARRKKAGGRQAGAGGEDGGKKEVVVGCWSVVVRRSNCGPEGSSVRVSPRLQQNVALTLVLGPLLREAPARGHGAARDAQEALRARWRLQD